ncbi:MULTISPECIES: hypothetical protein [unclassified Microcoleus]|uniref:hypothetical protein n=1 Tax=unclassified Microcoleus TaxID=2642155 RepID=UPI002FD3207D
MRLEIESRGVSGRSNLPSKQEVSGGLEAEESEIYEAESVFIVAVYRDRVRQVLMLRSMLANASREGCHRLHNL